MIPPVKRQQCGMPYPAVFGLYAMLPANTAGAMVRARTITDNRVVGERGSRPRLNLSNSKDIGNKDMTVSQTRENISEITVRLAPAEA